MAELGDQSANFHLEIGEYARQKTIDKIYTIGDDAKHYHGEQFENIEKLYQHLSKNHKNSTILIKGSRMMYLDQLVNLLVKTKNSA